MADSFHSITEATPEHRLKVAERTIQLLREEVERLKSENRMLRATQGRDVSAAVRAAKARNWRLR